MARSNGRAAVFAALFTGFFLANQSVNFVTPSRVSLASNAQLRSHVSLAATKEDIAAAQQRAQLLTWAANKLASDSSPDEIAARAMQAKAVAAVAEFEALKKGEAAPAAPVPAPVATAPAAAAPAAAAPAATPSPVSKAELEAARKKADLLTWSAKKLASEGSPSAPAMQAKADAAVAEFEALKKGKMAPAAPVPAPVASAPAATAPAATPTTVSKAELEAARKKADLLTWSAKKLASEGSPLAPAMQAKADAAVAEFEALKKGTAAPAAPVAVAPVASAPAATAPAATPTTVSKAELEAARKKADLLTWSAKKLVSEGSPLAPAMQAKADAAVAEFEALKKGTAAPAAPVAVAPVAAAPVATPSAFSTADLAAAKQQVTKADLEAAKNKAQLLTWAASKLAGSPGAPEMQAKADAAVAEFAAMQKSA